MVEAELEKNGFLIKGIFLCLYILDLTNLTTLTKRFPHELSGGEQQRACIARALIREPDLLLLDEPFSNLDAGIKHSIIDEIYQIIKATKTTTILVTHDIKDSLNIADKILVFKAGKLQQYDNPVEMYCKPANCWRLSQPMPFPTNALSAVSPKPSALL